MSRTFRRPSQKTNMGLFKLKVVRDGTRTRVSKSCENNGGCGYCLGNRTHKNKKNE